MSKMIKRVLSLTLTVLMIAGFTLGCGKKNINEDGKTTEKVKKEESNEGQPKVIKIGVHNRVVSDPTYKDPVTGQSKMDPNSLMGAQKGIDECKKQLNVELEFVMYPGPAHEVLLKSVLANDPLCDIAVIPYNTGVVISQNILQKLDEYEDLFKDDEYRWMMPGKVYGHNFILNGAVEFTMSDCLVYNISYLEKVDALKKNGKTVIPATLWKQGKWTWSTFEDYLSKVSTYYANKKSPVHTDTLIKAYKTDVLLTAISMIKTNGQTIFGKDGIGFDSDGVKKAVSYVEDLFSKKLITDIGAINIPPRMNALKYGETVFTDLPCWHQAAASNGLSERGESMGIVPYPRPDDISADDAKYTQAIKSLNELGILKGISKEKTDLAIKVFKLYYLECLKGKLGTDSVAEYFKSTEGAKSQAIIHGFDATNKEYGKDIVDSYRAYNPTLKVNEFYLMTTWANDYDTLLRNSILGLNDSPKYETVIDAQKTEFQEKNNIIQKVLSSDKIVDNIPPRVTLKDKSISIAKGSDASKIDWSKYVKVTDNIDGDIDIKNVDIDTSKVKFDTVGVYEKGVVVSVKDKEGNEKKEEYNIIIFDQQNKTAPTISAKETYRNIEKDEDVSKINWGNDFINKAESAEGFDLKNYITADITSLDVTKAGKYDVKLTVTDYAGNKTDIIINVTVA